MERFNIFFENSYLWIIPAVALAAFFSYLLYKNASALPKKVRILLGILRFILLSILLILLISPVVKQIINHYEKPVVILAIDNSTSITESGDSSKIINDINTIRQSLKDKYDIQLRTLNENIDQPEEIHFRDLTTNLHSLFNNISNDYENRNLAAVILFSDGLYNQGLNPIYSKYSFPIYSIGVGDTISYSDIGINQLEYNKLSYQGNKIPIQVELSHKRFANEQVTISIIHNGKSIAQRKVNITSENGIQSELFMIDATEKGLQRYNVVVQTSKEEKNKLNNQKSAYIDIVEGKKRILLIAPYPHPDIKALEGAISTNKNYEFIQYIPVINNTNSQHIINQPVDLIIMHQAPHPSLINDPVWKKFAEAKTSKWFITGSNINLTSFNQLNKTLTITQVGGQSDNITAWFNEDFNSFKLSDELRNIFNALPPVRVPFGKLELRGNSNVFLQQQIGRVQTDKPLFVTQSIEDVKEGVFLGDGLWQWRLYEYAQYQSHDRFNELIMKTVQYLSTREDKRKFRFYPVKNEFSEREQVIFDSEIYNDLYEPVYGEQINIEITDDEGVTQNFQYVTSESNTRYAISGLRPGVYNYTAHTTFNNNTMSVTGEFAIITLDLENLRLTADFDLLRQVSNNTGGDFYTTEQAESLAQHLHEKDYKERIQSSEDFLPLINIKWIGILLLLLISVEWITRKYQGTY